jgi:hypothetical protein
MQSQLDSKSFYEKDKDRVVTEGSLGKNGGTYSDNMTAAKPTTSMNDLSKVLKDSIRDGDKINKLINGNDLSDFKKDSPQKRILGQFFPQEIGGQKSFPSSTATAGSTMINAVHSDRSTANPLIRVPGNFQNTTKRDLSTDIKHGVQTVGGNLPNRPNIMNPTWSGESSKDIRAKPPLPFGSKEDHDSSFNFKPTSKANDPPNKITINSRKNSDQIDSMSNYLRETQTKEDKKDVMNKTLPPNPFNGLTKTPFEDVNRRTNPIQRDLSRPPQEVKPITISSNDRSRSQNINRKENNREISHLNNLGKDSNLGPSSFLGIGNGVTGSFSRLPDNIPTNSVQERYSVSAAGNKDQNTLILSRGNYLAVKPSESKGNLPITVQSNYKKPEEAIYTPHSLFTAKKMSIDPQDSPKQNKILSVQSPALNKLMDHHSNSGIRSADNMISMGGTTLDNQDLRRSKEHPPSRSPYADVYTPSHSENNLTKLPSQPIQRPEFGPSMIKFNASTGINQPSSISGPILPQGNQGRDSYYARQEKLQSPFSGQPQNPHPISAMKPIHSPVQVFGGSLPQPGSQLLSSSNESQGGKVVISSKVSQNQFGQQTFPTSSSHSSALKPMGSGEITPLLSPPGPNVALHQGPRPQGSTVIYSKRL